MAPLMISLPHSGEFVPEEAYWLKGLPETTLMCDVDRYVDRLYQAVIEDLNIPHVVAHCHRYVVDLNRLPDDFDSRSVQGAPRSEGFLTGIHWVKTTTGLVLMKEPISMELHKTLVDKHFHPFHDQVRECAQALRTQNLGPIYHLDAHSMPSLGKAAHRDQGETRAEVVVSDFLGKSCAAEFRQLVVDSFRKAGFEVALNWPYVGGRITQTYGAPNEGHHTIQVELRRDLYMNEDTKQLIPDRFAETQTKIASAVEAIYKGLS